MASLNAPPSGPPISREVFDVFLCLSGNNREWAQKLRSELADMGIRAFVDKDDIAPGQHILNTCNKAIGRCKLFVGLVSKAFCDSEEGPWLEIDYVMGRGVPGSRAQSPAGHRRVGSERCAAVLLPKRLSRLVGEDGKRAHERKKARLSESFKNAEHNTGHDEVSVVFKSVSLTSLEEENTVLVARELSNRFPGRSPLGAALSPFPRAERVFRLGRPDTELDDALQNAMRELGIGGTLADAGFQHELRPPCLMSSDRVWLEDISRSWSGSVTPEWASSNKPEDMQKRFGLDFLVRDLGATRSLDVRSVIIFVVKGGADPKGDKDLKTMRRNLKMMLRDLGNKDLSNLRIVPVYMRVEADTDQKKSKGRSFRKGIGGFRGYRIKGDDANNSSYLEAVCMRSLDPGCMPEDEVKGMEKPKP